VKEVPQNGANFIAAVNQGTNASPDWQPIGEQTSMSHEASREEIDGSYKTNDHTVTIYGRKSDSLSLESMMPVEGTTARATYSTLVNALENKNELVIRKQEELPDGTVSEEDASAKITSISNQMPDNDNASFSAEFTLQEAFTAV